MFHFVLLNLYNNKNNITMFELITTIDNIDNQINNTPIYYSRKLIINNDEYWVQYCHMSHRKTIRYEVGGIVYGCSAVQIIKKENEESYSVYKYKGTLTIDRQLVNNIIDDVIENIDTLEKEICDFFYGNE